MQKGFVETTAGRYKVRRPSLGGWRRILGSLSIEHLNAVVDAVVELNQAPDMPPEEYDPDAEDSPEIPDEAQLAQIRDARAEVFRSAGRKLVPVLTEVPIAAAALLRECLAGEDGKPALPADEAADLLDDTDLDVVLDGLTETGILKDLADRLKKRLRGLTPTRALGVNE